MKCLSLWQPWASLIALGAKRVETRDWPAPRDLVGRPLLIHAAKRWTQDERETLAAFQQGYPVVRVHLHPDPPRGCVVAVTRLVACEHMTEALIVAESPQERNFGAWVSGRWAWRLGPVVSVEPVPLRGRQGVFNVEEADVGKDGWARLQTALRAL